MSRAFKIALAAAILGVGIGVIYFRGLHEQVLRLGQPEHSEERARREVIQQPVATPTDVREKAKIFWAAADSPEELAPVEVQLSLSADAVQRAKQVLLALVVSPPNAPQRTLPADTVLLEFYLLPDGTAVADFSDALSRTTPSGILSEQMAVDSIARTLEANVPGVRRVKILINGQEVETLAGHADLTGFFELRPPAAPAKPELTPSGTPGKL